MLGTILGHRESHRSWPHRGVDPQPRAHSTRLALDSLSCAGRRTNFHWSSRSPVLDAISCCPVLWSVTHLFVVV